MKNSQKTSGQPGIKEGFRDIQGLIVWVYTSDSYDVSGLVSLLGGAATADRSDIDSSVASDVDISGADIVVVIGVDNAANN